MVDVAVEPGLWLSMAKGGTGRSRPTAFSQLALDRAMIAHAIALHPKRVALRGYVAAWSSRLIPAWWHADVARHPDDRRRDDLRRAPARRTPRACRSMRSL